MLARDVGSARCAHPYERLGLAEDVDDGRCELVDGEALEDASAARPRYEVLRAAARRRHDRKPAGKCLGCGDAEAFLQRRENEDGSPPE